MIKHHPSEELLASYVEASLPVSVSAAIAMHIEMCPHCAAKVETLTDQRAEACFEVNDEQINESSTGTAEFGELDYDAMIGEITEQNDVATHSVPEQKTLNIKGKSVVLPRAISNIPTTGWSNIGKLSRARFQLDEGKVRSSLLNIEPGGSVPEHTHKGYELTLLLSGSFKDDMGEYVAGDFIMLDGEHTHHPVSEEGCLCFTVSDDAQHFTQGINKLLNPIAQFLY
ncbi:anti-ECF sigma factor ChrR [Thalassotalea loyana]|uniref:Anti-ECF sigma factor ChrR n=1 Tax=Thalassotalea loyana TaxID=280483 RepID=A0ABQ6HB94_9GAMM|nr:ChrR family anti-sigma-E factor [Thalassotalea loyana]GLX84605.1 anti-ECF sigma factor ChrR [Thalassotalea loyana]